MQFARASGKDGRDVDPGEIFKKKVLMISLKFLRFHAVRQVCCKE